jgi:hypothetical protein
MARTVSIALVWLIVVLGGCAGILLLAHSEPSTRALDADLAQVREQINAADEEGVKYPGGLMNILVSLRREILRTSEAMLTQKRASLLRRIDLHYIVEGRPTAPADGERLSQIAGDLNKANATLSKDLAEGARYSGGLAQVMALMAAATDRLTIAQLNLAYYTAKYGMALPIQVRSGPSGAPAAPGTIVKDKDAF